jgi:hypothetical protein
MDKNGNSLGIVVCGFPGIGKSHFAKIAKCRVIDSDSSQFDKSDFPQNYVREIAARRREFDVVLVSCHEEVRAELARQHIPYHIVFPSHECKQEYLQRYRDRGNSELFIQLLDKHWDHWIDGCLYDGSSDYNNMRSVNGYKLGPGRFLSDVADRIIEFATTGK